MVWYRCSKCGREVEMPEGYYVCKICLTPLEPEKEEERKEREYRQLIEGIEEKPTRPRNARGRFITYPTRCDVCKVKREDWDTDWAVSDEEWWRIVPEPYRSAPAGKGGVVCPWCFVKFAEQRGEKYYVRFYEGYAQGVMTEKENAVQLFLERLLKHYGISSKMILEEAELPPPFIEIEEKPSVAYANYDWEMNRIIFYGEESVKLRHFLHEFYHMIQNIEKSIDRYRITPKYEKDMEQFKYGYKWMDDFEVGARRFVEAELPRWEREGFA